MKLRSSRVLRRVKPKIDSNIRNRDFSDKKRLSLRSDKSNSGKKRANESDSSDDKGVFWGSEVLDPAIDSVVSCPKEEVESGSEMLESETSADDTTVVNGECMSMPCKDKRGRKRKNEMGSGSGSDCNEDGSAKEEKVENNRVRVTGGKVLRSRTLTGVMVVDDGVRRVVLGLKRLESLDERPKMMLKHCGKPSKEHIKDENTRPKKKLKKRGKPHNFQGEITPLPLIEIPTKKLKRRGRPPKVSNEIAGGPMKSHGIKGKLHVKDTIFKKFKRRGRPPKVEAKTLATHVIKMRTIKLVSVKKSLKIRKKDGLPEAGCAKSEENGELLMVEEGGNASKRTIFRKDRRRLKQLVRDKISNILLKSGWTIDFRPRQEKAYTDSVYVEPNGIRSHWSITRAYAKLKKKIETGDADNIEISAFTPIPEEELNMLFRHQEKVRKDKNKKRIAKNVKKSKAVTFKKKKPDKKTKDGSKRKMIFKPRVLARGSKSGSKQDNEGALVIKQQNLVSWMIDSGVILAGSKVLYGKTRRQKRSSEGTITSDGIRCGCCNKMLGVSEFVVHCGGKIDHVFDNLYLESGTCLRNCLMDSWRKEEESNINRFNVVDVQGDDPNDDTCNICGDGGNLVCCDGCPSTFHQSCLDIQSFPSGDWNCIYCTCKFCGVVSVNTPQVQDSHDAITSQMLSCCLCEEKFHQSCLQEVEAENIDSNRLPFCGTKCQELFERLQRYLGVKHELEDGLSWTLLQRSDVDQDVNAHDTRLKVEHNSKLAVAFSVMDECFMPIVDERSGTSIIHDVVYNCGSNFRRLNYSGFLTAILEKGDEFITAASIRIHGYQLAEMPFIGTRHMYRRQGMCRRLLDAIECMLSSLGVEELIIPAIPALLQTWTNVFGFMPIEESKKQAMKCTSMLVFPGVDMLKKPLLQIQSADVDHTPSSAGVDIDIDHEQKDETTLVMDGCSFPEPNDENDPARIAGIEKDATSYEQTEEATVRKNVTDILTTSHGVNGVCDLNLPVKNVLPCDTNGQTSVDSESFCDCTVEPSSMDSVVCGNHQSPELTLDVENGGVLGVKVNPLTSKSVLKNTFDLNLHPTAVETDLRIISDDSVQCDSRSPVDRNAGGQTDSKTCESQPFSML